MANTDTSSPVVLTQRVELPKSGKNAVVVSLNRPTKKNCFNAEVCSSLSKMFSDIANEIAGDPQTDISAVIFTGVGKSFCAGADLSNPPNPLHQSSDLHERLLSNPVHQMSTVGVPIIGALRGHVITGGFELALACDILVGDETTKFRDTHVKFGLAPCWGLSQRLQRRIGKGRAALVSYTARPVPADQALRWGLLDDLVPSGGGDVLSRALEIADDIGRNDSTMVRRYKRALIEGGETELRKGMQRERELGIAHYLEAMEDGHTFEDAKEFITDTDRPRMQSKL